MGIDHGGLNVLVSQNRLNRSDIGSVLKHVRRERMAKRMGGCRFFDPAQKQSAPHGLGKRAFVNMMTTNRAASWFR
jgi:hypothetical protein